LIAAAYFAGLVNIGADSPWQIFSAAFYVSDYLPIFGWPLHHTWSLSVEERFYLLWPAILLFCGIKRAWLFPSLLIVGATASRMVYVHHFRFDGVADSLAVGCLAAIYRERIEQLMRRLWPRSLPLSALLIFPVLAVPLSNTSLRHVMFAAGAGILIFNVTVGVAMLAAIMQPPAWLNAPPIVWLGRISYSLYLWQQPWVADTRIGWIWLPAAIACAWLSYRFVEQPVLRWRDRKTVTTMHDSSQVARPHLHSSG
jgi:peptidoglycan/LPS O-acetylase OafA/YrhL